VPVRALFSSFLLALILSAAVTAAPAAAKTRAPMAKIALGAKKKVKKKKKSKKRASAKSSTVARTAAPQPAAPTECANTNLIPDAGNLELIRAAIMCLHNLLRAQNGLVTLAGNGALAAAAAGHSDDMVARGYFDHATPEGGTFDERILAAGYATKDQGWSVGENLAWGTGTYATPAGMMNSWMSSAGHRENILKPEYRELGLGIRLGSPTGAEGVTVSAEFGVRS
jgi:uncharacterized protein YkwD